VSMREQIRNPVSLVFLVQSFLSWLRGRFPAVGFPLLSFSFSPTEAIERQFFIPQS